MSTITAILVGGPADGRRVAIPTGMRELSVAELRVMPVTPVSADVVPMTRSHLYREVWGVRDLRVYAYESLTHETAMQQLLAGYRSEIVK